MDCPRAAGDTDKGGAVGGRPGQVAGSLVAGHQPLIGVHQGVGHRRHALHVGQQTGDEGICLFRQALWVIRVVEGIFPALEQGHVSVHPRAIDAEDGLGHKGGVEAIFLG